MKLGNIIKGHVNEALGLNNDISLFRLKICNKCPIRSDKLGGMCNRKLYLNPETDDVSLEPKKGYFRGCGCRINSKTRLLNEKCPAGKW